MNQADVYPKTELLARMYRYCWDENRLLPIELFAAECDCSPRHFRDVFQYHEDPLPDWLQIRASRVLQAWERGEIRVMQNRRTRRKFLEYREVPQPRLRSTLALSIQDGRLTLQAKTRNLSDYSEPVSLAHGDSARLQVPRARPVRKF